MRATAARLGLSLGVGITRWVTCIVFAGIFAIVPSAWAAAGLKITSPADGATITDTGLSRAEVIEQTIMLPVEVKSAKGEWVKRQIPVTVFRDDSRSVSPFVIVHHGRAIPRDAREKFGRVRFPEISRYLVERGFAVFIPTRLGYGETADNDVEWKENSCDDRDFPSMFAPASAQATTVLDLVRQQPYVDKSRGILFGNSFGGMVALTIAAHRPSGVLSVMNFAGGAGGDSKERPGNPCNIQGLAGIFSDLGKRSTIPTVWLYSENDQLWGPTNPRDWHKLYVAAGGKAEFVQLPAIGEDGHHSFTRNQEAWKPVFERFLHTIGFKLLQ